MTKLFKEGALSLDNLLYPGAEAGAGPRHLLPGHVCEPVHDGGLQGVQSVVTSPVDGPFTGPPEVVVNRVAVWASWHPQLLPPEVGQVGTQPVLGHLGVVGRGPVLLEDVRAPGSHLGASCTTCSGCGSSNTY